METIAIWVIFTFALIGIVVFAFILDALLTPIITKFINRIKSRNTNKEEVHIHSYNLADYDVMYRDSFLDSEMNNKPTKFATVKFVCSECGDELNVCIHNSHMWDINKHNATWGVDIK